MIERKHAYIDHLDLPTPHHFEVVTNYLEPPGIGEDDELAPGNGRTASFQVSLINRAEVDLSRIRVPGLVAELLQEDPAPNFLQ